MIAADFDQRAETQSVSLVACLATLEALRAITDVEADVSDFSAGLNLVVKMPK
jgi:hypothetical protein